MGGKSEKRKVKPTSSVAPADEDQDEPPARPNPSLYDWAYHGTGPIMSADDRAHILVEDVKFGPTERRSTALLRELAEPVGGGFNWGYHGTGPLLAAAAILADALSLGDPAHCGLDPLSPQRESTLITLRGDFTWDVMSQLGEEWRLRRGAVLRWVRGWYDEHRITALPQAAAQLPPVNPHARRSADETNPTRNV